MPERVWDYAANHLPLQRKVVLAACRIGTAAALSAELLLALHDRVAEAPDAVNRLRRFVLESRSRLHGADRRRPGGVV